MAMAQSPKHRLVILADMGNEPDEMQQMVHMMMYANEFDLEGLIAVTGKYLNPQSKNPYKTIVHPELFHEIIDGYEETIENLQKHATGWPSPDYLRTLVASGQKGYGVGDIGLGKHTEGSQLIEKCLEKDDDRPLYVVVNAGSNTLAQALIDYEAKHSKLDFDKAIAKLRVFENGAQDDAGAWINKKYPNILWVRSNYQTYSYGGPIKYDGKRQKHFGPHTWKPYDYSFVGQHQWLLEHIKANNGIMGKIYPNRQMEKGYIFFLEGGGTIPWMGLIHQGLSNPDYPNWGGWSGRFSDHKIKNVWSRHKDIVKEEQVSKGFSVYTEAVDKWYDKANDTLYHNAMTPVWRWRQDYFNDFKCRMDWCLADYKNANHNPIAAINNDNSEKIYFIKAKAGKRLPLNAKGSSDPDGDTLTYEWWIYSEAGTYKEKIQINSADTEQTFISIPKEAKGKTIHVILTVRDTNSIASLCDYRRVVVEVK